MRISLIVPIRDEEDSILGLMESLGRQTYKPDEIILVDGGSKDRTVQIVKSLGEEVPSLRLIIAEDATPGRGRNIGIEAAKNEWVALTDAGITLDPEWLGRLVEVAEKDPAIDIVYGNYEPIADSYFERCASLSYPPPKTVRPGGRMRGPSIASVLLKRSIWKSVGGFPDLRAAEDLIFIKKVEQSGFVIGWAPEATVRWRLQPSLKRTFRKFVLYSRQNVWAGMQKYWHYGIARQYLVFIFFIILAVFHNRWWILTPLLLVALRAAKSIWIRREGRGINWALNPIQLTGVIFILLTIDLATFTGWVQALRAPLPGRDDKK